MTDTYFQPFGHLQYDWDIRNVRGEDIPFIYSSWLESYASTWDVKKSTFMKEYRYVIDEFLGNSHVLVACKKDEHDVVFGYLVADFVAPIIHYCYVKEVFRKQGIAKSLFKLKVTPTFTITHRTSIAKKILNREAFKDVTYNPFLLFNRGEVHAQN
jgi:GNAT superfamily N-acetyltransferase